MPAAASETCPKRDTASWWPIALLAAVVVVVSLPASMGGWVYDDWTMRDSEAMDGADDLAAAFRRTSSDYFQTGPDMQISGVTYRPLTMLTLIIVQTLREDAPLPHHIVSLVLHLMCAFALWRAIAMRAGNGRAISLVTIFALHPLAIEAYGWINGRSDLVAGLALALLAWLLAGQPASDGKRRETHTWLFAAAAAAAALLAKETAALSVVGLAASELLPERGLPDRAHLRARAPRVAALALGVLLALTTRATAVGFSASGAATLAIEPNAANSITHLLAESLRSMLVPLPRTMRTLAWELGQSWSTVDFVVVGLAGTAIVALAVTRRWRALILLATALATIVPAIVVRHSFWQGLDRYLYMPAILLALAVSSIEWPWLAERLSPRARRVGLGAIAVVLAWSTFTTAQTYAGQAEHMAAMIETRPEDPTGYLIGARFLWHAGQEADAANLIDRIKHRGLPPAIASELATLLGEMGRGEEAVAIVDEMARRHPDDPWVLYDVVSVQLSRHKIERAFAAANRVRHLPAFCRGVHELMRLSESDQGTDDRRALREWRRRNRCP